MCHPIVAVRKYIKKRRPEVSQLNQDMLDEIDGVIVSEFNAAYGGICDDALSIEDGTMMEGDVWDACRKVAEDKTEEKVCSL
jgi:hypothetical protein